MSDEMLSQPGTLKNALMRFIRSKGVINQSATQSLDAEWKRIVGPELGRRSTARKVRDGIVEVVVTNSATLEELRGYMHETVLEQMKASLPQSNIRTIKYVRVR